MLRLKNPFIVAGLLALTVVSQAFAAVTCDQYGGDASIYGGLVAAAKPNVLIIIDTSGSMDESIESTGSDYIPGYDYTAIGGCTASGGTAANCTNDKIYKYDPVSTKYVDTGKSLTKATSSACTGSTIKPRTSLTDNGMYSGKLSATLACSSTVASATYFNGRYLNWLIAPSTDVTTSRSKIEIARSVVKTLIASTSGVKFGLMRYRGSDDEGSQFVSAEVDGITFNTTVKDLDEIFTGTKTNREALISIIDSSTFPANGSTPLAESLLEASRYFEGGASYFANTIGLTSGVYTSPIVYGCQKNYVILVTDGESTADDNTTALNSICTKSDCDGDGAEPIVTTETHNHNTTTTYDYSHSLDDVAKYMYNKDYSSTFDSKQNIQTYVIGYGSLGSNAAAVTLLNRTTDSSHGNGKTYMAKDQAELSGALKSIMNSVFEVDSSFVAPVVPVSPDNRTYNSKRVYMAFFKPVNADFWEGNLKKYGLNAHSEIIDSVNINTPATNADGTFKATAQSYWSSAADAGDVASGGVGAMLLDRNYTTDPRQIYTYTGSDLSLTGTSNAFTKTNTSITTTLLGLGATATSTTALKNSLVDYIYGLDAFNSDTTKTSDKRSWIMGDILHSKPLVVNYKQYDTSDAANYEPNCTGSAGTVNGTMIYVGSNDGMLHAFRDCDGKELWGFIPPIILPNLKEMYTANHTYFVDSSPVVYYYDKNLNGNIESADGDKVVIAFGLRRGGGVNALSTEGAYYALDVTDPAAPKYLWGITKSTTGFSQIAEGWGEPRIAKMRVGSETKIVAIVGAGYDNMREDSRYGDTQGYSNVVPIVAGDYGSGAKTSVTSTAVDATKNRGRGLFIFSVATLNSSGVPTLVSSPSLVWGFVNGASNSYATNPATSTVMTASLVGEVVALDTLGRGYSDRIYAADIVGNLWRFDIASTDTANWTGTKIFAANDPSSTTGIGRKVFYKPSVTMEATKTVASRGRDAFIFVGTGDREHPLNTNVVDRIYGIKDKGQTTTKHESDLLDVSTDQLQVSTTASGAGSASEILYNLTENPSNYGWYIKFDQRSGEKVLAPPLVFNKVVSLTTFTPGEGTTTSTDACQPSNLGQSRIYSLNYLTGEAVMNYNTANDTTDSFSTYKTANVRAIYGDGKVLLRADREKNLGQGIASGVVPIVSPDGTVTGIASSGAAILPIDLPKGGGLLNLYWKQK